MAKKRRWSETEQPFLNEENLNFDYLDWDFTDERQNEEKS